MKAGPSHVFIGHAYADGALNIRMPAPRIALDPDGPSVSVVVPAMNEARNLPWLAERMPDGITEIILVDGRSADDTVATAKNLWPNVRVVTQTRHGKGNALACGFAAATGDIIVMIDADGSMDPGEIPYFVAALTAGADYAKGSRFTPGGGSSDITRFRRAGNSMLNGLTSVVHKTRFTDLCYGYNAMWRHVLPVLGLQADLEGDDVCDSHWGDGFEVETLMNIRVYLAGLAITEVPSFETPRLHGGSNLRAVTDGCRVLTTIAREHRAVRGGARFRRDVVAAMLRYRATLNATEESRASAAEIAHAATHAEPTDTTLRSQQESLHPTRDGAVRVIDLSAYERKHDEESHHGVEDKASAR